MESVSTAALDKRFESVTVRVTEYWPEIVGMPLRVPSVASRKPGGSAPPVTAHE